MTVAALPLTRPAGEGWLALIGGGEFSFGETLAADQAWLEHAGQGPVGFLATASGSTEYGEHFASYLDQTFQRQATTLPVYRARDARRGKNVERLDPLAAVYLGGGVTDHVVDTLQDSPFATAVVEKLGRGGVVVAMAAAAQALGASVRSLLGGDLRPGLGWLPGGVVEPNFDPGHDRRLRQLMAQPSIQWGLGLPAGSCVLLGANGVVEVVGTVFLLEEADGDYRVLGEVGE